LHFPNPASLFDHTILTLFWQNSKVARDMLYGKSDPLDSAFRLTYGMITNLTRLEGHDAESLTKQSFAQFQRERKVPLLVKNVEDLELEKDSMEIPNQKSVTDYVAISDTLATLKAELRQVQNLPQHAAPFLSPGRLLKICVEDPESLIGASTAAGVDGGRAMRHASRVSSEWAVLVSHDRQPGGGDHNKYELEVLCVTSEGKKGAWEIQQMQRVPQPNPLEFGVKGDKKDDPVAEQKLQRAQQTHDTYQTYAPRVVTIPLTQVDLFSSVRVYLPNNLKAQSEGKVRVRESCREVLKRFPVRMYCVSQIRHTVVLPLTLVTVRTDYPDCCPYIVQYTPNKWTDTFLFGKKDGVPALDLEKDMRITTKQFRSLTSKIDRLTGMLSKHPLASDPDDAQLSIVLEKFAKKRDVITRIQIAKRAVADARGTVKKDELLKRLRVLRRLDHLHPDENVALVKGKVACEMQTSDELVATELIFDGTFKELDPGSVVALVSALLWREGQGDAGDVVKKMSKEAQRAYEKLQDAARVVAKHEADVGLDVESGPDSNGGGGAGKGGGGGSTRQNTEAGDKFRPELMDMARRWMEGAPFSEIMKMANSERKMYEGSIVRAFRRVQEFLRMLAAGARVVGETELEQKFDNAADKMIRDIVFCDSLFAPK
jgi:ATP-dependent RNA helicase DOB1